MKVRKKNAHTQPTYCFYLYLYYYYVWSHCVNVRKIINNNNKLNLKDDDDGTKSIYY